MTNHRNPGGAASHAYLYLGIYFRPDGTQKIYAGDPYIEDLLVDDNGNVLSLEDAMGLHPHYTIVLGALNSIVRKKVASRAVRHLRKKSIYLCYRWENDEARRWVKLLAGFLRQRGYRVILDQDEPQSTDFLSPAVMMSKMAECGIVVMVLTRYFHDARGSEGGQEQIGWVLDEQVLARKLRAQGVCKIVHIKREHGSGQHGLISDTMIDISHNDEPWDLIGKSFPFRRSWLPRLFRG